MTFSQGGNSLATTVTSLKDEPFYENRGTLATHNVPQEVSLERISGALKTLRLPPVWKASAISQITQSEWFSKFNSLLASSSVIGELELSIDRLEDTYEFRNPNEIGTFLRNHSYLIDFLYDAFSRIELFFGRNPHVALEVIHDPEIVNASELFAYIHTTLPPEEAMDRLTAFDEIWFLDQVNSVNGKLNFDLLFE